MKIFYHGSYLQITNPSVAKGRDKVDFGKGFYLTSIQEQAEKWAKTIAIRKGPNFLPVVNVYRFDYEAMNTSGVRVKVFPEYNLEWLNYVVDCRRGGLLQQNYDFVEGGIANDNVIDTVEDFESGRITAEQALGQLCYKAVNQQICIRNQQIIDKNLQFVESYTLDKTI